MAIGKFEHALFAPLACIMFVKSTKIGEGEIFELYRHRIRSH